MMVILMVKKMVFDDVGYVELLINGYWGCLDFMFGEMERKKVMDLLISFKS